MSSLVARRVGVCNPICPLGCIKQKSYFMSSYIAKDTKTSIPNTTVLNKNNPKRTIPINYYFLCSSGCVSSGSADTLVATPKFKASSEFMILSRSLNNTLF